MNLKGLIVFCLVAAIFSPVAAKPSLLDNTCTFRVDGRLFVLTLLNRHGYTPRYYT